MAQQSRNMDVRGSTPSRRLVCRHGRRRWMLMSAFALVATVAACGGGGSSSFEEPLTVLAGLIWDVGFPAWDSADWN
jgi:hypothetical protein